MKRRSPVALALLVAVALTASACGSSGKSASPDTSGSAGSGSGSGGDAAAIFAAMDRSASTGPQKMKLDLSVDIKGTPSDPQLAAFTKQPIKLGVDGVVDATGGNGDLNVSVSLGGDPIEAGFRYGGGKSWIRVDGKWYDGGSLSAATGQTLPTGTATSGLDPDKILAAAGDPAKLFKNTSVSDGGSVEGVETDKVSGDIDLAAALKAGASLSKSMGGTSGAPALTDSQVESLSKQVNDMVKTAHVDMYVGKTDHRVHRTVFTIDAAMDDSTKSSSGIESVSVNLDVTTGDSSAPDVSAPSEVGTASEFQGALMGLLGKFMGGTSTA